MQLLLFTTSLSICCTLNAPHNSLIEQTLSQRVKMLSFGLKIIPGRLVIIVGQDTEYNFV